MAAINIKREHQLGLQKARELARQWQEKGEEKYDLTCDCTVTDDADEIKFKRSGVSGKLRVTDSEFIMDAKLGFLLSAFKERIETEINKNLDKLIASNTDK